MRLTTLLMFGEANNIGVFLEEEDKVLRYLTSAMTVSSTFGKCTFAT